MSDTDSAANALTSTDDLVESTFSLQGTEYPMTIRDTTEEQLEELERVEEEEELSDLDAKRRVIDKYLVKPDVDADRIKNPRKVNALFTAMIATWSGATDIRQAFDEMALNNSGNR